MNTQKTHTEVKKELLYQLESIVKTLYPKEKTMNPYESYLAAYYEELNIEDVLLFKRLLKSVTLMNHKERVLEGKYYVSSYGDVLITIELISRHTINDTVMRYFVQLKDVFRNHPFTVLQAQRVLRKSYTSVRRYLKIWNELKLIRKSSLVHGKKYMYELDEKESVLDNFYEEAMDDFKENKGYVNLEQRT